MQTSLLFLGMLMWQERAVHAAAVRMPRLQAAWRIRKTKD
jgi:hypothetical protein